MTSLRRQLRFRRDHRWTPAHLSAYLDGELVARSRARLQHHIKECPECRAVLAGLQQMLNRLQRLPAVSVEPTPDIAAAIRGRLHEPPSDIAHRE